MIDNKTIIVLGGTGSFGKKFTEFCFQNYKPKKIIIFSRDEFKQFEMSKIFPEDKYPIRYFIGDIRDKDRLYRAFDGVDYVIHAAAMKQVPTCEYNPFEAVKTNILGAQNIVDAAIDKGVKKVIALSTDKAVNPINLYGSTKLSMEKLLVAGNYYAGSKETSFALVRYGNVVGSRGSVIPFFLDLKEKKVKKYPITDVRMTRFWITLEQGVKLVLRALEESVGGELFIPQIPSMRIMDLLQAIDEKAEIEVIGIRPGEKLHESLISEDEGRKTIQMVDGNEKYYIILPQVAAKSKLVEKYKNIPFMKEGFTYRSDLNSDWISKEELMNIINKK